MRNYIVTHMIEFSKEDVLEVSNKYINVDMKRQTEFKGIRCLINIREYCIIFIFCLPYYTEQILPYVVYVYSRDKQC